MSGHHSPVKLTYKITHHRQLRTFIHLYLQISYLSCFCKRDFNSLCEAVRFWQLGWGKVLRRGRLWPQRGLLADRGNSHRALPSVLCCTSSLIYTWLSGAKRTRLTLPAYFLLSLVTSLCRVIPAEAQVGSTETFKDALLGPRLTLHLHTCPALPLRAP